MSALPDLLFLTQRIPFPPDKGDKIRSFNILRHLSRRFRIHLGCFLDDPYDERYLSKLSEYCASVSCIRLRRPFALLRGMRALMMGASLTEGYFRDVRMQLWVDDVMQKTRPEHIFVFCSAMAPYVLRYATGTRIVMDAVDVDSEKWSAYADVARWPLNLIYAREQAALLALERRAAVRFTSTFFVSEPEMRLFTQRAPETAGHVSYFVNGVDFEYFDPHLKFENPFEVGSPAIVFVGAMDYRPNIDAAQWFSAKVLPEVRKRHPDAQFWIVGANPSDAVRKLASLDGVHVTGRVGDVRPYLSHAACVVAPLQIARGIQNKVLEAMAMARPLVATTGACEGLNVTPGADVLVANGATEFAAAVVVVLEGLAANIGKRARARIESDYHWDRTLRTLDEAMGQTPPDIPRRSATG